MQKRLWTTAALLTLFGAVTSCGYVSEYEKQVYDWEPVYCYKSLAAVQCFKEPRAGDERRLVNYYGPDPSRYDRPDTPEVPELQAPKEIDYWVKDEEPVAEAVPQHVMAADIAPVVLANSGAPAAPAASATPQRSLGAKDTAGAGQTSFLDRLLAPFFGKPKLANAPLK